MIFFFHSPYHDSIRFDRTVTWAADGYEVRKIVAAANRPWPNMVDIESLAVSSKFRLMGAASLTGVIVASPSGFRTFFPIVAATVVLGSSAFPGWMSGASNMFHLPCRITFFRAKDRIISDERCKRLATFTTTLRNILRSFPPALVRARMNVLLWTRLIGFSTYFADSLDTLAAQRSYFSAPLIAAFLRTKATIAPVAFVFLFALFTYLKHLKNISYYILNIKPTIYIERRMSLIMEGHVTRAHAGMKARGRPVDNGPLFGWSGEPPRHSRPTGCLRNGDEGPFGYDGKDEAAE